MDEQSIGRSDTPLPEVVADMPLSDNPTVHTVSSDIDTGEQAGDSSAPLVSQEAVDTPPSQGTVAQQYPPVLRIAGELRNKIYNKLLNLGLEDRELFQAMHNLASTCRQLRSETWSYYLEKKTLRLDLRGYQDFIEAFYPSADEAVMKNYRGKFVADMDHNYATYSTMLPAQGTSLTIDLRPLIVLLRASPSIQFELKKSIRWVGNDYDLEKFINHARTSEMWAAISILNAVNLRTQQALVGRPWDEPIYWIVDVHLKRSMQYFYKRLGLLAYLEERSIAYLEERSIVYVEKRISVWHDGIVFCMVWDKPDPAVKPKPKKIKWFRILKDCVDGALDSLDGVEWQM